MTADAPWWQDAIIYQVYPRSFQDSNGDGVGDLRGIIQRLDYLERLGVTAVWISPIFPSPMADFGYDVSDYTDVHPLFGSLADLDELVQRAHQRGIRIILDLVPNHTSDQHPWFIDARRSRDSEHHDWYVWHPGQPNGDRPNNWLSVMAGPAWEWNEATREYYYHAFLPQQPDLNWRNPDVRTALYDVMRYWFDRGIDGFRIDVIWHLIEDEQLRDNPPNPEYRAGMGEQLRHLPIHTTDQPEVLEIVHEMREVADAYDGDRLLIGEIYLPLERLVAYYGETGAGLHLPYNFHLLLTDWTATAVSDVVNRYEALLPPFAWPNWVLSNHDRPRVATRVGAAQARVAALLLMTLRGTPTVYYGDEIGMADVEIPPDRIHDPVATMTGTPGRDPQRTPMQWDASDHAGFTTGAPWLPQATNWPENNVAAQERDDGSILSLYRELIRIRTGSEALRRGHYRFVSASDDVFVFERAAGSERWLVAANFSAEPRTAELPAPGRITTSTHAGRGEARIEGTIELLTDEAVIVRAD